MRSLLMQFTYTGASVPLKSASTSSLASGSSDARCYASEIWSLPLSTSTLSLNLI